MRHDAIPSALVTVGQAARIALRAAGVTVHEIERVFPPHDTGGEVEIWFVGRTPGQKGCATRQTAYLRDSEDAEPTLADGW
jgi:hypothetical protein